MQKNLRLMIFAILSSCLSFTVACGDLSEDCDPTVDEGCVCTLDEDDTQDVGDDCIDGTTEDGAGCTCTLDDGGDAQPDSQPDSQPGDDPQPEAEPEAPAFRFILVEDQTGNPSGDFPGADVDAISVIKASGDEFFAESFEAGTEIDCDGNLACDASALLGAPDAVDSDGTCFGGGSPDGSTFTALNAGFVIVQFSSIESGDVVIENGDDIHVFEVGSTECGRFDDDPFSVSVSTSDDVGGTFIELGDGGTGSNIVPVTGL